MKQAYVENKLRGVSLELIGIANAIIAEYMPQNLRLTVRQLYYQLVSRDVVPNTVKSYKRVVSVITEARLAGLIDWDAIEDRARAFKTRQRWTSPEQIISAAASGFHMDMWANQEERPFVLIEKEALAGVLEQVCHEYDVPLLACKGYPSATVLREFALYDIKPALQDGQRAVILHLGDHDPSGIDMTRDIEERIAMFAEVEDADVNRLALNMPQIERLKPPPNPAKPTDSRYAAYVRRFKKKSCWELDALPPEELQKVVRRSIVQRMDPVKWDKRQAEIERIKRRIKKHAAEFK